MIMEAVKPYSEESSSLRSSKPSEMGCPRLWPLNCSA